MKQYCNDASQHILVTGFEPFGGENINPAWMAVEQLPSHISGALVSKLQIPVVFDIAFQQVEAAVARLQPDIVVCVGQAAGRAAITPEFVAINYAQARIPDNAGIQPKEKTLVADGPAAYFATLPVQAMVVAMQQASVPATVSYTAGTYVCNEVMYRLLHLLATKHPDTQGTFIHVPYATQQVASLPVPTPSMSVDTMTFGLTVALETAITYKRLQ
ncbi:pyroglutamyl-peptidase I [Atopobium fossor]|uniref:pyroglutamyl-peptidase I n=1 Tax=Atopobium fossor TaxID=39487 RepID=UPI00041505C0|nr:pyroglutamyl-peptidase I [Atopobium fossor]